jgi:arylsulfatase A-like enzyme/Tfp pilus assembly protein PilF
MIAMRTRLIAGVGMMALIIVGGVLYRMSSARSVAPTNILLITIDTLRADHVGAYGYTPAATPTLDALARRGLRFNQAITVAPLTLPAHASLMTGTFPGYHGVRDNGAFVLDNGQTTLAEVLHARGYRTGAFVAAFVLDRRWGLHQGFDEYADTFDLAKYAPDVGLDAVQRPGSEVVDEAIAWANQESTRPFFAWVHLYEPHAPYDAPAAIRARFPATTVGAYDAEVATADVQVGRLLNALSTDRRLDRTIVAVLGDHGEALGDHQELEHGFFVYGETVRIPLILAGPGLPVREIADQVRIVDVMPTLLNLARVDIPQAVQGQTLVPLARGNHVQLAALSETWYPRQHFGWSELTAIRDGRYTFVAAPRRELYDTQADPGETRNLAVSEPARADALERALRELTARTSARAPAPAARPIDAQTADRLRSLGYIGGGVSQQSVAARALADPKDKIGVYNLLKLAADQSVQGRLDEAIGTVRKALDADSTIVEGYTMLGAFQLRAKRENEALSAYEQALALDPHSTKAAWQLADILMRRHEYAKAEAALKRAIADAVDRPAFLTKLGECQIELGRLDDANRNLREALLEKPDQAAAHYDLALIHEARGDSSKAIAEYEAELLHNPRMDRAHFNLAKLLTANGRRSDALRHFEAAVDANPEFGGGYLYLAKARLDAGDLAGAEEAARKGVSLEADDEIAPLGHYVLADVYNRLGRPQDAAREAAEGRRLENRKIRN